MRVLVLMSTYNGAAYIRQQIDSILAQDACEVGILIRDDGSTDGTQDIMHEYASRHDNIFIVDGPNVGCAQSFMSLVYEAANTYSQYDYYAFCDQDDVWLINKLSSAIDKLDITDSTKPSLYLGAYQMVDAELNPITTFLSVPAINLPAAFASNSATGCTMVFNRALLMALSTKRPEYMIMHDYWAYLVCLAIGGFVCYDHTPYILYRQHGHNAIGGLGDSLFKKWSVRIRKLFLAGDRFKSRMAQQLLNCYQGQMASDDIRFLCDIVNQKSFAAKKRLITDKRFRCKSMDGNLRNFVLILTGKF